MKFYTTDELAALLHISIGTVRNRMSHGALMPPHVKIGRRVLFPVAQFEKWTTALIGQEESSAAPDKSRRRGRPRTSHGSLA